VKFLWGSVRACRSSSGNKGEGFKGKGVRRKAESEGSWMWGTY